MIIVGISGATGSGKDTTAKYVLGKVLVAREVVAQAEQDNNGNLLVNYSTTVHGKEETGMGIFDVDRQDPEFLFYMREVVWPHVKIYRFADLLKQIAIRLYGFEYAALFGTQEDKAKDSHIKWGQIYDCLPKSCKPAKVKKDEFMTNRQFIQYFSDILRFIDPMCITKALMNQILIEQPGVAIIADIRDAKEADAIHELGGKTMRLTKTMVEDSHNIEHAIDGYDKFTAIVDNRHCSIVDKNKMVDALLKEWGVV